MTNLHTYDFDQAKAAALLPVIQAMAEGKPIQVSIGMRWTMLKPGDSLAFNMPAHKYRVARAERPRFRLVELRYKTKHPFPHPESYVMTVRTPETEQEVSQRPEFMRFLSDWTVVPEGL
jgi:hypothetical protein